MKKIEEITVAATPAHTRKVEIFVCDFCGLETKHSGIIKTCKICERHACQAAKGCAQLMYDSFSDYPDAYCPLCYRLRFDIYRKEIDDIQEEAYRREEEVMEKIKRESLAS